MPEANAGAPAATQMLNEEWKSPVFFAVFTTSRFQSLEMLIEL